MENSNEPKAIETNYRGIRFRSRLEARWAVFFDALNIDWEYESEGYDLSGRGYLPDFKLTGFCGRGPNSEHFETVLWCEVKGVRDWNDFLSRKKLDWEKVKKFSNMEAVSNLISTGASENVINNAVSRVNPIIILPNIPEDVWAWWGSDVSNFWTVDGDDWPCIITKPDLSDKKFVLCGPDGESYPEGDEISNTKMALSAARSKRFEFSEADLVPLENEIEILRRRAELEEEKRELLRKIQGGN